MFSRLVSDEHLGDRLVGIGHLDGASNGQLVLLDRVDPEHGEQGRVELADKDGAVSYLLPSVLEEPMTVPPLTPPPATRALKQRGK